MLRSSTSSSDSSVWARLLPPLGGLAALLGLLAYLRLDPRPLLRGDLSAASESLRLLAESHGFWRAPILLALSIGLPFLFVPITVVFLAMALTLPASIAVPTVLVGCAGQTWASHALGRSWGAWAMRVTRVDRMSFFQAVVGVAKRHEFIFSILVRMVPLPFALAGVLGALAGARARVMALGTVIAMTPMAFVYVYFAEGLRRGDTRAALLAAAGIFLLSGLAFGLRKLWLPAPMPELSLALGHEALKPRPMPRGPLLTLYTVAGDPACIEARVELARLRDELGFEVEELDIASQSGWAAKLDDHAPVVFLGSDRIMSFQVDENLLRQKLAVAKGKA